MKFNKLIIWLFLIGVAQNSFSFNKNLQRKDSLKNTIQGRMIDAYTKMPLPSAWVSIKDTKVKVKTDSNGEFKLVVPRSLFKNKIILVVYSDFEPVFISVKKKELPLKKDFPLVMETLHPADDKPPVKTKK